MDDEKKMKAWIIDLSDPRAPTRCTAAYELGKNGNAKAVEHLAVTLRDGYLSVRVYSAEAMGKIGHSSAIGWLIEALTDPDPTVLESVLESLAKITNRPFSTPEEWRRWYGEACEKAKGG